LEDWVEGAIFWWEISIKGRWRGAEWNEAAMILQLTYKLQLFFRCGRGVFVGVGDGGAGVRAAASAVVSGDDGDGVTTHTFVVVV